MSKKLIKKKKNNVIIFSHYFIKKRIIEERRIYQNEVVGECCECHGLGYLTEKNIEMICISCDGIGTFYYGKENTN